VHRLELAALLCFGPNRDDRAMPTEGLSAHQLSELIVRVAGVQGLEVAVRFDHAYGWQPLVIACPGDLIGFQRRVEEIANQLRGRYALSK
jgi:hypothetical protein